MNDKQLIEGYYYTYLKEEGWRIYEYKIMSYGAYFFMCGSETGYDPNVFDEIKPVPMPTTDEQ